MDNVSKILIDNSLEDDLNKFLQESDNGKRINTENVYFSHCVFTDEDSNVTKERYGAVIDSSVTTPHNRFFIDIVYRESLSAKGGWTGFEMIDSSGWCVDTLDKFSNIFHKDTISLDEITDFITKKNDAIITPKTI